MDSATTFCPNLACPGQRTNRSGPHSHARVQGQAVQAHLVEPPRALGQVQADEIRVKTQGGIGWMALALMVKTRLWLAGESSEPRDMTLIRRLIERVRAGALQRPLLCCTDGLSSYIWAIRETCREPVHTGAQGRPRLRPWRNLCMAQVVKRYAQRRVVDIECRIVEGRPARVETLRPRSHGAGGQCLQRTPVMAAGITDHGWSVRERLSYHVPPPRWTPPKQCGRPSHALKRLMERWCMDHG